ncbi:amidase [Actinocrinis puniceicyclus]|uniref:amidase n=1 Tax=Actinocrinis puniceicyclus TaxID=977794 RepID=UPI0028AA287B|nr:amidase [Actinocrinis puniceicyclus]
MTVPTAPAAQIAGYDALGQAELVRRGEVTAAELVDWAIERIDRVNPTLNAVVTPLYEAARADAARSRPGPFAAPFAGVPFLVKDLAMDVEGAPFTAGSRFLRGYVSDHDSELVRRHRRAGLVIVGKTNTPEFGTVGTCEPLRHGPTRNPWDPGRSTSGSSGGSAAAVAAGLVPMAHANDLAGSIRYPASACGLFGLKPTRARTPKGPDFGDVAGGWACEHAITRSVRDSAALLDATAGAAPGDPYPAPPPARRFLDEVGADPGRLRIAFSPRTADGSPPHPDCLAALDDAARLCEELGHELVEAQPPALAATGDAVQKVLSAVLAWTVLMWERRFGREVAEGDLEPLNAAYLRSGRHLPAAEYLAAVQTLQAHARKVAQFFQGDDDDVQGRADPAPGLRTAGFDAWLTPTLSTPPAPIGEITSTEQDPLRAARNGARTHAFPAVLANLTGNPAMSVPLWWNADGLPIGVHFLGRFGDEATLLRLAGQLEQARPWAARRPRLHA